MNDNRSSLTPPVSAQSIEPPPAPPLDLSTPTPQPASIAPTLNSSPTQELETPSLAPVEHDITPLASVPTEELTSAPLNDSVDESAIPEATSAIPSMPASSIPPMPSLDSLSAASSPLSNPAPTTSIAPTQDSVNNVSAPAANPTTPPIATQSASNVESAAPAPAAPTASAETKPLDTTQPKKSKALVFVVIFLALVALILGGLVVWSATQPETISIGESMTPPVVPAGEEVEQITEEEVIVEQSDETTDWKVYTNEIFTVKHPTDVISHEQQGGVLTLNKTAPGHPDTELFDGLSLAFETHDYTNMTPIEFAQNKIKQSVDNGLGTLISGPEESALNGYEAATYTFQGLGIFTNIVVKSPENDSLIVISNGSVDPNNNGYQETVDQILSTFTFSDVSSTSGAALQGSCTQDGVNYADGDDVPAPDSCNSCSCENGQIACTAMACEE